MFKLVLGDKAYELLVEICELIFSLFAIFLLFFSMCTHELKQPLLHEVYAHRLQISPNF